MYVVWSMFVYLFCLFQALDNEVLSRRGTPSIRIAYDTQLIELVTSFQGVIELTGAARYMVFFSVIQLPVMFQST